MYHDFVVHIFFTSWTLKIKNIFFVNVRFRNIRI